MGRKGGKKAAAVDNSEIGSTASTSTFGDLAGGIDADEIDDRSAIEIHIDALYEKRGSTRESGLSGLVQTMLSFQNSYEVEERLATLTNLFVISVRRGGSREQELAANALGLLCVNLGCSSETQRVLDEQKDLLLKVAKAGKSSDARVAGADSLSMAVFIASEDHREALEIMQEFEGIFNVDPEAKKKPTADVRTAAISGWSLLLTTIPQEVVRREGYFDSRLGMLGGILHDSAIELREAAGEAIAVLYDAVQGPKGGEEEHGSADTPDMGMYAEQLEDVRSRMQELAKNMGDAQRRSKKDRSAQKTAFREILSVLDGQGVSEVKLKLRHGDMLYVDNLPGVTQLNAFRRYLAGGFQDHLQNNPLLHDVFDFQPREEPGERLTKTERRMFKSPNSAGAKARQKERGAGRAHAAATMQSMLGQAW